MKLTFSQKLYFNVIRLIGFGCIVSVIAEFNVNIGSYTYGVSNLIIGAIKIALLGLAFFFLAIGATIIGVLMINKVGFSVKFKKAKLSLKKNYKKFFNPSNFKNYKQIKRLSF